MKHHLTQAHQTSVMELEYIGARAILRIINMDTCALEMKDHVQLLGALNQGRDPLNQALHTLDIRHAFLSDHATSLQPRLTSIEFPIGPMCPSSLSAAQNHMQ